MKKLICLLLVVVMICTVLSGCEWDKWFNKSTTFTTTATTTLPKPEEDPVSDDLKLEIIERYLILSGIQGDKKPEEIECEFYGKYGDSVAVYFHTAGAHKTPTEEEIVGYKFSYRDSRVIKIYNNRRFYTISEAYELGFVNDENIASIYDGYKTLKYKKPYFIFEPKYFFNWDTYYRITQEEDFMCIAPGQISVGLDNSISHYRKDFNFEFFDGIDIDYVENDNFLHNYEPDELNLDPDSIGLWYIIHLKDKTEEAVFEAIAILEKNDAIQYAEPVYWFYPNSTTDYRSTPNDPYLNGTLVFYDKDNLPQTR